MGKIEKTLSLSWKSLFACYGKVGDSPGISKDRNIRHFSFSDASFNGELFSPEDLSLSLAGADLHVFTLAQMKTVTMNFSACHLIGEGGFGPVYKGFVDEKIKSGIKPQPVAVKILDKDGHQGHREWLVYPVHHHHHHHHHHHVMGFLLFNSSFCPS